MARQTCCLGHCAPLNQTASVIPHDYLLVTHLALHDKMTALLARRRQETARVRLVTHGWLHRYSYPHLLYLIRQGLKRPGYNTTPAYAS